MNLTIFIFTVLLLLIAEGTGAWTKRVLGIERRGYHAPVGFAFLLSVIEVLSLPALIMDLSFHWVIVVTCIVLAAGCVFLLFDLEDVRRSLFRWETLIVLACMALFIALSFRRGGVLTSPLEQDLSNKSVSALQAPKYQAYYHFAVCFAWLCNLPAKVFHIISPISLGQAEIYGLGMFYTAVSSMVIVDVVRRFHLKNHWFEFSLLVFLLLNGNYTAWSETNAWLGSSWLILFTAVSMLVCYSYVKSGNEQIKYLLLPVFGAGFACDNGFGLCSVAVLYGFLCYLLSVRKIRCLFDFFTFLIPLVLYVAVKSSDSWWWPLSWMLFFLYLWFSFRRYHRPLRRWIARTEEFLFDHGKLIMIGIIPALMTVFSLIITFVVKNSSLVSYSYYFQDFTEIPGIRDYIFLHSDIVEIILNIFRWGGAVCLYFLAEQPQDRMMRSILICTLVLFVNPLCTPAISYMTGPMFVYTFSVLFNPCTEGIMFLFVYRMFQWTVIGQWVLELTLCFGALFGLVGILLL